MTPRLQNADCRSQDARGSVSGGWGVPTWPLTLETLWCQKSDAGRGGNPDRRLNREAAKTLQRPRGQDSPRAPWVQVLFLFGASDSPAFNSSPKTGTSCAANSPKGHSPNGPVPPEHNCKPAFATWVSGNLSSTPSVSCGGFIPGLSARVVVWFIGVEVSLSVVVHAGPFGGVRDVTTDAPGVGPSTDAGRLLFHGSRPWLKRTWPKSRTNERSRKCRECRQPQPSKSNPEFPFLPSPGLEPRSTRGPSCATVIRSLFPRRPRSSSRRLRALLGSGTGSRPALLRLRRTACRVCGVGESKVGESTGLPRRKVWGALSVQDREDLSPTPRKKRGPDNRRGSGTDDRRGSRLEGVRDPLGLSEAQPVQTRGAIGWEQSSPVVRQAVKLPEGALSPTLVYGGGWGGFDEMRDALMSQSVRLLSVHVIA